MHTLVGEASYGIYLTCGQILLGDCPLKYSQLGHGTLILRTCESQWFCICIPTHFQIIHPVCNLYIRSSWRYLPFRTPTTPFLPSWLVMLDWRCLSIVCDKVGSSFWYLFCLRLSESLIAVNSTLSRFNFPAGSFIRSLSAGWSSKFFTDIFRSPGNHG